MKTGREFLNEHIEETNIPAEHWEVEIGGNRNRSEDEVIISHIQCSSRIY